MRTLLLTVLLLIGVSHLACNKTIHEAGTPAKPLPAVADAGE